MAHGIHFHRPDCNIRFKIEEKDNIEENSELPKDIKDAIRKSKIEQ